MFQKALPRGEQQKAAEILGVDAGLVSRWASGAVKPTTANRMAIQAQYGIPWDAWDDHAPESTDLADAPTEEVTPAEAPAPKRLSSRPPPPADAFDEESTTVRDAEPVRHVPPVKFSDREKVETDPDPRAGEVLARTPKPLTALDVPNDEDRTPTPSPDGL